MVDISLPLGSQTVPGLSYQFLISHNSLIEQLSPYYTAPALIAQRNVSSFITRSFIAVETACSRSSSLATAVTLSPVYTTVILH
jgi:hypothetical protein